MGDLAQKGDLGKWLDLVQIHRLNSDFRKALGVGCATKKPSKNHFLCSRNFLEIKSFHLREKLTKTLGVKRGEEGFYPTGRVPKCRK